MRQAADSMGKRYAQPAVVQFEGLDLKAVRE
jgi:hypothetical protein